MDWPLPDLLFAGPADDLAIGLVVVWVGTIAWRAFMGSMHARVEAYQAKKKDEEESDDE